MRKVNAGRTAWGVALAACLLLAATQTPSGEAPQVPGKPAQVGARPVQAVPAAAVEPVAAKPVQASDKLHAVEMAVQKARAAGAGEDEAYRLRAAALPAATIAMLTEREQAEKHWLRRVEAWRAAAAGLNHADAAALRERLFSADEQARLGAYEPGDSPQLILR